MEENDFKNYKYNKSFYNYFHKKYSKYYDFKNKKRIRDGLILIREPIDCHYNPTQNFKTEKSLENFINNLRLSYSILVKFGSFQKLEEKIKKINSERINK